MENDTMENCMEDYFLAIATYFEWNIDWKTFFIEASKLLNYLEATSFFKEGDKARAAQILIDKFELACKNSFPKEFKEQGIKVLTYDKTSVPDQVTFEIDEIYENGHSMMKKYRSKM